MKALQHLSFHQYSTNSSGGSLSDQEVKRAIDNISEMFSEAMDLMGDAVSNRLN